MAEIALDKIPRTIKDICDWCYPITNILRQSKFYWRVDTVGDSAYLYNSDNKMLIWIVKHNITFCLPEYTVPIDCPEEVPLSQRMLYAERLINKYGFEEVCNRVDDRHLENLNGVTVTVVRSKALYDCFNERLNDEF